MASRFESSGVKSITRWIRELESGNDEAARLLWGEYFAKLVALARRQLGTAPRRAADEEDVAVSVFGCLCEGARRRQLAKLKNRDELWRLLVVITNHKVVDRRRRERAHKRGGTNVRGDSVFKNVARRQQGEGFDGLASQELTPEYLVTLEEEFQRLMQLLPTDEVRTVAIRKMEGYKNDEIAKELGLARRSIQRKLNRIRQLWSSEITS